MTSTTTTPPGFPNHNFFTFEDFKAFFENGVSKQTDAIALFEELCQQPGIDKMQLYGRTPESVYKTISNAVVCLRDHYHQHGPSQLEETATGWANLVTASWDDFKMYFVAKQGRIRYYEMVS
ncbi:hypothetical protein DFS34DRAFT_685727 [Phlyctochytrium arcticum]|nr:hypothetical protein DFS34DRAFT_685727 [Phlyctochytrium arcticum]